MSSSHDIDAIIDGVRSALPAVIAEQLRQPHPADDNGLWRFRLPGSHGDIQIESSSYDCPFLVESSDTTSTAQAFTVETVPEAIAAVVSYLRTAPSVS